MSDEDSSYSNSRRKGSEEETSDEEPEDEDEYDSEEEEEARPTKKRKKTNKGHYGFVIEEAEVDDDMEDEEEWEGGAPELGIDIHEAEEVGPTAREIEGRQRGRSLWENRGEDEIEDYFRRKYASTPDSGLNEQFGEGEEMSDEIFQQTLLPSVKDPNLWLVKCRIGEEKATALLLMRKFLTYERTDRILQIKSVVAPEGAKGFIYLEAYKQANVKEAIENVGSLKVGYWSQQMVPIKEMTDVLDVHKEQINLAHKQWVRPKRGIYKDDIAQVDFVEVAQNKVILKLVPRIDYTKKRGALRILDDEENEDDEPSRTRKRKRMTSKNRSPPKLFDPEAIKELGGEITPDGDFMTFEGNRYSAKGFLYKSFNIKSIISEGVKPTLSELEMFEDNPEETHFELPVNDNTPNTFRPGDNVEVCSGELAGLMGKILSVEGKSITIMPYHEALKEALEFQTHELQKCFEVGDHVRIIDGKHEGDTGFVIRVEPNRLVIFSDLSMHEMEVFSRYVQLCPDVATGVDSVGQFQFGDLVSVDSQTVGVIVRLEREIFHVLTMHGKIQEIKPQGLSRIPSFVKASALDSQQNTITRNDTVQIIDGPHSGRNGKIKYLYRYFAFIQAQNHIENGGIIVCKTRHVQLQGCSKITLHHPAAFVFKPPKPTASPMIAASPLHSTENIGNNTPEVVDFGGGGGGGGRASRRHRDIIGSTVKIIRGPYKGTIGYCKDATETTVRVELTSSYQTVTFSRANIQNMEPKQDNRQSNQRTVNPISGSQTPMYRAAGSKTPMYEVGSRTPHYGSTTPSSIDGSRTPQSSAWDPSITNTPARPNDFDDFNMGDDTSQASFTRGYDPSVAPFTPQITDSEDWDADSSASPAAHRAKVATPPTRRGPLVREGRPKTFNRPVRETPSVLNRKLGEENWDDEDDGQPKRFDPRANERPAGYGHFQKRPTENWNNNNKNITAPVISTQRLPVNSHFAENRRNDVPKPAGGLGSTENWDDEDDTFNTPAAISTPQVSMNSRFENKRNDVPRAVGGLGSTERWDDEDNFTPPVVPSTPHVPINPRFENKRNDVPRPAIGLDNSEKWDDEDNCTTPVVSNIPHVPVNPRFENNRKDVPQPAIGLDNSEKWGDNDNNFNSPVVTNTPRLPMIPRFENKRNNFPRPARGRGNTRNWENNDSNKFTSPGAAIAPRIPKIPRFENKRNDAPQTIGGLDSTENWDDDDDAPVNCPSIPFSTKSFNYNHSPIRQEEYPEPTDSVSTKIQPVADDAHAWLSTNLEVIIKDSYNDWDFAGQDAVVNSITGSMCNVTVKAINQTTNVPCDELIPLIPEVNERVKIIKGEFCNQVGTFESLVDKDGVVRTDSGESQVISLEYLCKTRQ